MPLPPSAQYVHSARRLRRLRGLAKRGQEFIRVGKSLPLPFRRSTMGFKTRNRGPRRRLSGKAQVKHLLSDLLIPSWGLEGAAAAAGSLILLSILMAACAYFRGVHVGLLGTICCWRDR